MADVKLVAGYHPGACIYCGAPCRSIACGSHRDLLPLDPAIVAAIARSPRPEAR